MTLFFFFAFMPVYSVSPGHLKKCPVEYSSSMIHTASPLFWPH